MLALGWVFRIAQHTYSYLFDSTAHLQYSYYTSSNRDSITNG